MKKLRIILLLAPIAASLAFVQAQTGRQPLQQPVLSPRKSQVPIVDYAPPVANRIGVDAKRQAKNARYDSGRPSRVEELPEGLHLLPITHGMIGIPAIPTAQSDLVARGRIVGAQAYLSNDGTGVYSEFSIRVEEVFKGDGARITPGTEVTAERPGGVVRFPSGQIQRYGYSGQGMPQVGQDCVLFLKNRGISEDDFSLVTSYELLGGHVFPIDGKNGWGGGYFEGDKYDGIEEPAFLQTLLESLKEASTKETPNEK